MPHMEFPEERVPVEEEELTIRGYPAKMYVYAEKYSRWFNDYDGRHIRIEVYLPWDDNQVKSEFVHDRRYGEDRFGFPFGYFGTPLPPRDEHEQDAIEKAQKRVDEYEELKAQDGLADKVSL